MPVWAARLPLRKRLLPDGNLRGGVTAATCGALCAMSALKLFRFRSSGCSWPLAAIVIAGSLTQPAIAWDGFGHMVVASVAYRKLDSKTRARVDALLALNPYFSRATEWPAQLPSTVTAATRSRYIFMLAATWPDQIKSDGAYHNDGSRNGDVPDGPAAAQNTGYDDFNRHKYWHFVDTPFSQDGTDVSSFVIPSPDAKTQIDAFRMVLKSDSADPLKSYDLVWLLHLVGDVHQPLHASTRVSAALPKGDAGGNSVPFCTATSTKCESELHAFWDNILGTGKIDSADKFAATVKPPKVTKKDIADTQKWVDKSFQLARTAVYVNPPLDAGDPPFRATTEYAAASKALATKQVGLAGARLAMIIKDELK